MVGKKAEKLGVGKVGKIRQVDKEKFNFQR